MTSGVRRSRCETPNDPPLLFSYFLDENGTSPVLDAMSKAGIGGALPDGMLRYAQVEGLLEDACRGELDEDPDVFKPVVRNPYIWEMVFEFSGQQFRMYIGEPVEAPGHIIALHFHFKDVSGTQDEIRQRQNSEINIAIARFDSARADGWRVLNDAS